jgi:H+/Cl- antiporter ClcA
LNNFHLRRFFIHHSKWFFVATLVGFFSGTASAFFLFCLDVLTAWRESHPFILFALPLGGFIIGWIYHCLGQSVEAGNNLLIDEIHDSKNVTPLRMSPIILFATLLTHLVGGSAGREGTAVQMGGSLADRLTKPFGFGADGRRILLMAGISAGFASVFGTPLAGAVFGLEVVVLGRIHTDAIFPCLIAAIVGHEVTLAWGIHHALYSVPLIPTMTISGFFMTCIAGVLFGLTGRLFVWMTHVTKRFFTQTISYSPFRPVVGGLLLGLGIFFFGTTYLGLGLPTMQTAFSSFVRPWDWLGKLVFTVLTLGSGFKGGEVTPLFFIGATLGNSLSSFLALPSALLAGLGFVAVFAGAANTPIACTLLAMELMGTPVGIYAALACVVSYLFSGHTGIYSSQRIEHRKHS